MSQTLQQGCLSPSGRFSVSLGHWVRGHGRRLARPEGDVEVRTRSLLPVWAAFAGVPFSSMPFRLQGSGSAERGEGRWEGKSKNRKGVGPEVQKLRWL